MLAQVVFSVHLVSQLLLEPVDRGVCLLLQGEQAALQLSHLAGQLVHLTSRRTIRRKCQSRRTVENAQESTKSKERCGKNTINIFLYFYSSVLCLKKCSYCINAIHRKNFLHKHRFKMKFLTNALFRPLQFSNFLKKYNMKNYVNT